MRPIGHEFCVKKKYFFSDNCTIFYIHLQKINRNQLIIKNKMKKYGFLTTVCVGLALIFTACDKEGVYNPKQKISKIYAQSYYGLEKIKPPKELAETWTWDKNRW
jgi:hypothetical protein